MTTAAGRAACDIARWGLVGPAGLLSAMLLNATWGGGSPGCALYVATSAAFAVGGAMAGAALPSAGPGVWAALAGTYAAGGQGATAQAFLVWSDGIDDSLSFAVFLAVMLAFAVILPVVAAIAFAIVPGRRLRLAGRAADSLDALSRDRMLERGLTAAALAISAEIAFVIGATGVARALEDRPPA